MVFGEPEGALSSLISAAADPVKFKERIEALRVAQEAYDANIAALALREGAVAKREAAASKMNEDVLGLLASAQADREEAGRLLTAATEQSSAAIKDREAAGAALAEATRIKEVASDNHAELMRVRKELGDSLEAHRAERAALADKYAKIRKIME